MDGGAPGWSSAALQSRLAAFPGGWRRSTNGGAVRRTVEAFPRPRPSRSVGGSVSPDRGPPAASAEAFPPTVALPHRRRRRFPRPWRSPTVGGSVSPDRGAPAPAAEAFPRPWRSPPSAEAFPPTVALPHRRRKRFPDRWRSRTGGGSASPDLGAPPPSAEALPPTVALRTGGGSASPDRGAPAPAAEALPPTVALPAPSGGSHLLPAVGAVLRRRWFPARGRPGLRESLRGWGMTRSAVPSNGASPRYAGPESGKDQETVTPAAVIRPCMQEEACSSPTIPS